MGAWARFSDRPILCFRILEGFVNMPVRMISHLFAFLMLINLI
ncbi:MAG: hypothetical protein ETSY2_41655 [Candidatus Entotheonella gemina]|uniref:Uncharacterized protein n=1 Tax=Candidatus Entotheonella gemina TaxID=1429439 RepID=W4LLU0_9BACT|nr:MAG: hypothetical protein ETSY2_41655 [Candidatus Entotheonella gemina]